MRTDNTDSSTFDGAESELDTPSGGRTSRRQFILGAGAAGAALASAALIPGGDASAASAEPAGKDKRTYTGGRFSLDIAGFGPAGYLRSVDGGTVKGEVVVGPIDPLDGLRKKHIGNPKYEDCTIEFALGMGKGLYDWIKPSFDKNYVRKSGSIVSCDYNVAGRGVREFTDALITEVSFPKLDGASKEPAFIKMTMAPTSLTETGPPPECATAGAKQKQWLCSNFRLTIPGLDCTRVNKVEALSIKMREDNSTGSLVYEVDIPNVEVTLAASTADSWVEWFDDFVVDGTGPEKTGTLSFLAPDKRTVLGKLDLGGLGIIKVVPEKMEAGSESIKRIKAEMYCESMVFDVPNAI